MLIASKIDFFNFFFQTFFSLKKTKFWQQKLFWEKPLDASKFGKVGEFFCEHLCFIAQLGSLMKKNLIKGIVLSYQFYWPTNTSEEIAARSVWNTARGIQFSLWKCLNWLLEINQRRYYCSNHQNTFENVKWNIFRRHRLLYFWHSQLGLEKRGNENNAPSFFLVEKDQHVLHSQSRKLFEIFSLC